MRKTCFLFSNTCFVFPLLLWNQQGKRESLMIPIRSGLTQMCAEELKDQNKTFCFLFSAYKCVWSNSVVPPEIFLQGSWKILSLELLKDPYKVIIIYKSSMSKFPPRIPTVLLNQDQGFTGSFSWIKLRRLCAVLPQATFSLWKLRRVSQTAPENTPSERTKVTAEF